MKNDDGEADKVVLWFEESEQGLVANKTNFCAVINITGHEDSDYWLGAQIVLAREVVAFGGRMVPAIRVKKPRRAAPVAADFDDPIP